MCVAGGLIMEILKNYIKQYSYYMDKFLKYDIVVLLIKIIIPVIVILILINIIKGVINTTIDIIKKVISKTKNIIEYFIDKDNRDIQKNFLSYNIINKDDFLWIFKIFSLERKEKIISLIKSSIIFLINDKYLKIYFSNSLAADSDSIELCKCVTLKVKSLVIIPNKVTYAEILLKNDSDSNVYFKIAEGKKREIFYLTLCLDNGECRIINIDSDYIE